MKLLKWLTTPIAILLLAAVLRAVTGHSSGTVYGVLNHGGSGTIIANRLHADAVGASGALAVTSNTIDIVTSVLCVVSATCTWTGYQNMSGGQLRLPESTVASLPAAASNTGKVFRVTDSATAGSCTSGSGSAVTLCYSTGSAWAALGDGNGTVQPAPIQLWAGGCDSPSAGLSGTPWSVKTTNTATRTCNGTNGIGGMSFADTGTVETFVIFQWPSDWTAGAVSFVGYIGQGSDTPSARVSDFGFKLGCITTAGTFAAEPSYNTAAQTGEVVVPASGTVQKFTINSITATGCDPGDLAFGLLFRDNTTVATNFPFALLFQGGLLIYTK